MYPFEGRLERVNHIPFQSYVCFSVLKAHEKTITKLGKFSNFDALFLQCDWVDFLNALIIIIFQTRSQSSPGLYSCWLVYLTFT
jgi:hypothetical protein